MTRRQAGVTLIEACAIFCLVGVGLAVFVPTFFRRVRTSKFEEPTQLLEDLDRRARAYYRARHEGGARCLPAALGPTPADVSPNAAPFLAGSPPDAEAGWAALGFAPEREVRFRYRFEPAAEGCGVEVPPGEPLYRLRAEGDLDGDGVLSRFERLATLSDDGRVVPLGPLRVTDRTE
ncbi:MAG: hypothetical protein AAF447_24665 [Myxococcota bacterium]